MLSMLSSGRNGGQLQPTGIAKMDLPHTRNKAIVLVVEDDALMRMLAADFIEGAGFEVVEAESADAAVIILEAREDIGILFTDIDMPGSMDGMKLAVAVRDRWPPIEIVVVSGNAHPSSLKLPERAVFYSKPYDVLEVTSTLRQMAGAI